MQNLQRALIVGGAVALSLHGRAPAVAQNATTGAIQGVVSDQATSQALAGVTVVVASPSLQGQQSTITEAEGEYKITNLPPGVYTVTFFYSDVIVRRTGITVSINKTTPVYIKIDTAQAGGEIITIEGRPPSVDPTSTAQGAVIDQDYTRNLPIPGRTFEAALGAAAGAEGDQLGVSFSGSTSIENSYVVDGINTTGLTYGTIASPLINDFIEQTEIITGGYNAEYGRSTGGVVNVVTKSGSNELHGSVFTYARPGFLEATRGSTPTQSGSIDVESRLGFDADVGFELGGPIIKDKVWFYVGLAPRLTRTYIDRVTKRQTDCRMVLDTRELTECDPAQYTDGVPDADPATGFLITDELDRETLNRDTTTYQIVSKVNFAVSPEHQGQVSFIGFPGAAKGSTLLGEPLATQFETSSFTSDLSGRWLSKVNDNKTELEAVLGWHYGSNGIDATYAEALALPRQNLYFGDLFTWGQNRESPATLAGCSDEPGTDLFPAITNCPDGGDGYAVGGLGGLNDTTENRLAARLSATQRVKAMGFHELKAGVDLEDNRLVRARQYTGGVFYNVLQGNRGAIESRRWVRLQPHGTEGEPNLCGGDPPGTIGGEEPYPCTYIGAEGADVSGQTINWGAYLRDSWQVVPQLTVNVGVRYEEQRLRYADDLQDTVDPFTGADRGTNAMVLRNMWAPRLGLLYDWTKEGRSKVYAHWGRFYESIPMDINDRAFGGETSLQRIFDSDQCGGDDPSTGGPSGPNCEASGEPPDQEQLLGSGVLVAPGIKPQYLDELIFGVEYEVLPDLKLGVAYKNRVMGRVIEDVSVDNADTYILANPGEWSAAEEERLMEEIAAEADPVVRARLESELEQYRGIRIFDKPRRDYHAFELTAVKRFSDSFFVQGSYTYSRTEGNYPGLFSADTGQVDPNITSQYDLIELLANRDGPLPQDSPHSFKVDGYYRFDLERHGVLTTGGRIRASSGMPVNALGRHHMYGTDEAFILPRGALGRTDFYTGFDLHLGYARDLGRGMTVEVFADMFNVFNQQGEVARDSRYTIDPVNPIVGGEYEDLVWARGQTEDGDEIDSNGEAPVVRRNPNFGNTTGLQSPFSARLGARLVF